MYGSCSAEAFIIIFESIKVKVTPRYAEVGTEGRRKYISNLFATSALEGGWPISTTLRPLYHREISVAYFTGGI